MSDRDELRNWYSNPSWARKVDKMTGNFHLRSTCNERPGRAEELVFQSVMGT
nr:MAG TPA: hypothetical protein [Bacteriophage sp.]